MKDAYQKFINLYTAQKSDVLKENEKMFDEACVEFKKAESLSKPSASLLVKKGKCIQLSSENCPCALKDAEQAFKDAIIEDEACIEAYIELAHYYLNIQNAAEKAKTCFEKALRIAGESACESVCGIALCLAELDSEKSALDYLSDNSKLTLSPQDISKTIYEIKSGLSR